MILRKDESQTGNIDPDEINTKAFLLTPTQSLVPDPQWRLQALKRDPSNCSSSACGSVEESGHLSGPVIAVIVGLAFIALIVFAVGYLALRRRRLTLKSRSISVTPNGEAVTNWVRRQRAHQQSRKYASQSEFSGAATLVNTADEIQAQSTNKPFSLEPVPPYQETTAEESIIVKPDKIWRRTPLPQIWTKAPVSQLPSQFESNSLDMTVSGFLAVQSDEIGGLFGHNTSSKCEVNAMSTAEGKDTSSSPADSQYDSRMTIESGSMSSESSENSIIPDSLEISTKRAIETLMLEFRSLLDHSPYLGISIRAGAGKPSPGSCSRVPATTCENATENTAEGSSRGSKRARRDSTSSALSRDEGDLATKKSRKSLISQQATSRKFACPFYKHDSSRNLKKRSCAGPGWDSTHRVKEHIYRTHKLPAQCVRCSTVFSSEAALVLHQRQLVACERQSMVPAQGINSSQEKLLRKRPRGVSEEEKWVEMYKILFPDEDGDLVPTPYYETSDVFRQDAVLHYERIQRRELLRLVRKRLEEEAPKIAGPLEDGLRTQFIDIIREAQTEVYQSYRKSSISSSQSSNDVTGRMEQTPNPSPDPSSKDSLTQVPIGQAQIEREMASLDMTFIPEFDHSMINMQESINWSDLPNMHFGNGEKSHVELLEATLWAADGTFQESMESPGAYN